MKPKVTYTIVITWLTGEKDVFNRDVDFEVMRNLVKEYRKNPAVAEATVYKNVKTSSLYRRFNFQK